MSGLEHNVADLLWQGPGGPLHILSFQGTERLSQPFQYNLQVKSRDAGLGFQQMLYAPAKVLLKSGKDRGEDRHFSGIITHFEQGRTDYGLLDSAAERWYIYHIEIRPKFYLATQSYCSRVFQKMTAQAIISEVLGAIGVGHSWKLGATPPKREYCLQYQESDFQFVSRLLEDEGITYYFDKDSGDMVMVSQPGGFPACSPTASVRYSEDPSPVLSVGELETVHDFNYGEFVATGQADVQHYNPETSATNISAGSGAGFPNAGGLAWYEHSRNYPTAGEGQHYAAAILGEAVGRGKRARGRTSCRSFSCGYRFNLSDHFRGEWNSGWTLVSCSYHIEQGHFRCHFTAIQAGVLYQPPRVTPKARVNGVQTAVVTGPPGSLVYLDDMGRCKLQFHWDREGPMNDRSSLWIRVLNNYAGKDYGIQFIPRVGHEVLVGFVDGDPDQPIVVGRAYNDQMTAPLGPAEKYQNIIKTIKDHHIIFDDSDGKELIDIRSHKDMKILVVNDESEEIGNNQTISVGNNCSETIGNNLTLSVGNDRTESIGNNHTGTIGNNRSVQVGNDDDLVVGNNQTILVGNDQSETIGSSQTTVIGTEKASIIGTGELRVVGTNRMTNIGANEVTSVAASMNLTVGAALSMKVGAAKSEKVGAVSEESVGSMKMLNVGAGYTVTVGGAQIISTGAAYMRNTGLMESINVGLNRIEMIGMNKVTKVQNNNLINVSGGNHVVKCDAGGVMIDAQSCIIKVGGSQIVMTTSGIKVEASTIMLN
ncbi:type VI secretion system Vgr family protein [Acanthopleuribacter pedis]|uniref:Type VI secretion system tip protein VgrG n=1 Tax=Acanthopleuribacter pedis TaxID=442870 RepID=A0A8J7U7B0_9BACT|nr:type VI secretion system tip protein TssI/VgrG [Acanthopleuribacter pedis]MBO1322318.1 type VI secretion system tip protein VgrG [Acanthopleuribacter pedis]